MAQTNERSALQSVVRRENGVNRIQIWVLILVIYSLLLVFIGYIAFWDQDFNRPEYTIGRYIKVLNEYKQQSDIEVSLSRDEVASIVSEIMSKNADNSIDLQQLATQSFNIVLGALLAFLSGSVTMVFQHSNRIKTGPKTDD